MIEFVCFCPDGNIVSWGQCQPGNLAAHAQPGETALAGSGTDRTHYVAGGVLTAYAKAQAAARLQRPAYPCRWDNTAMAWLDLRDLAQLRADKWAEVKAAREAALAAPLATPLGTFDADERGSASIVKSVLLANNLSALGYPVAIDFTLADNSTVVLDAAAMVQVGLALASREQLLRARASVLREQIASASAAELPTLYWN